MTRREYGYLCPEGHGVLMARDQWTTAGVIWCASSEHGGNGRFYRFSEVEEGTFDPDAPRIKSEFQLKQETELAERERARKEYEANKPRGTVRKIRVKTAVPKEPKVCECECGGLTKGGRYLPGHDARHHARLKREAAGT